MYSSVEHGIEVVDSIVDHGSFLWQYNMLNQQGAAGYDTHSWAGGSDVDLAGGQYSATDGLNAFDNLTGPSVLHMLPTPWAPPLPRGEVSSTKVTPRRPFPQTQTFQDHSPPLSYVQQGSIIGKPGKPPQVRKRRSVGQANLRTPHKVVEQRYRHNLNAQIELLSSRVPKPTDDSGDPEMYPKGTSKAEVMTNAIGYINTLEEESVKTDTLIRMLQGQVAGLQKLLVHERSSLAARYY